MDGLVFDARVSFTRASSVGRGRQGLAGMGTHDYANLPSNATHRNRNETIMRVCAGSWSYLLDDGP